MPLSGFRFCVPALILALTYAIPAPAAPQASKAKDAAAKAATSASESSGAVQTKLDAFAKEHVQRANTTLRPNRQFVEVKRENGQYVAWFSEVDPSSLRTELHASNMPGCQYVGHVIYQETVYTCTGKTKVEAQKGDFKPVKVRRIRELTRYDKGKWCY